METSDQPAAVLSELSPLRKAFWGLIALIGIVEAGIWCWRVSILLLAYPYCVESTESWVLAWGWLPVGGYPLYKDFSTAPFIATVYPPLILSLESALLYFVKPALWIPRLLAFAGTIGVFLGVQQLIRGRTGQRDWRTLLAFLVLLHPMTYFYSAIGRPDMIACALTVWAIVCWQRGRLWAVVVLFLAAYFSKHSFVAAPLALWLQLMIVRDPRRWRFFVAMGLGVAGGILLGTLLWGRPFLMIYEFYYYHPIAWHYIARIVPFLLFWLAGLWAMLPFLLRNRREIEPFYFLYPLVSLGFTFAAVTNFGSNFNLYLDFNLSLMLLLVVGLLQAIRARRRWVQALVALQLAVSFQPIFHEYVPTLRPTPRLDHRIEEDLLAGLLREKGGKVLCYPQLEYCFLNGQTPPITLFPMAGFAATDWDPRDLIAMIESGEYPWAVLPILPEEATTFYRVTFTDEVLQALYDNYLPVDRFNHLQLYRHRTTLRP